MCWPRVGEANPLFSVCITLWRWTATATLSMPLNDRGILDYVFITRITITEFEKKKKKTTYYVRWMINIVDFSINLLLYRRQILLLQGIVDKSLEACISNFCRVLLVSDKWLCFLLTGERMVKLNTIKRGAHSNLFHIVLKYFIIIYRAVLGTREKQCTGTPTYTTTLKKHTIRNITRL